MVESEDKTMPPKKQRKANRKAKREAIMKSEKRIPVSKRRRLIDLDIESVHLVDKAANRRRFLITKNDKGGRCASLDPSAPTTCSCGRSIIEKNDDILVQTNAAAESKEAKPRTEKTLKEHIEEIRDKLNGVDEKDIPEDVSAKIRAVAEAVNETTEEEKGESESDGDKEGEEKSEPDEKQAPEHPGDAAIVKPPESETKAEVKDVETTKPAQSIEEENQEEDEDEPSSEDEELSEDDQADCDALYEKAYNEKKAELVS